MRARVEKKVCLGLEQVNYAKGTEEANRVARHTTRIYISNAAYDVMPPIYFFISSADNSDNFQVKPTWVQGIPKVRGKYGCPTNKTYDSSVAVRKSGYTNKELIQKLI